MTGSEDGDDAHGDGDGSGGVDPTPRSDGAGDPAGDAGIDWTHPDLEIRRLRRGDVPAAHRLSTQAGWNQLAVDWKRLLVLAPTRCFAGWTGGDLVGTATAIAYDRAAWIGMVLVDEAERGQGYGTALFRRALVAALEDDLAVGLDATDLGAAVYRKEGFAQTRPITRWAGPPDVDAVTATVESFDDAGRVAAYDRSACGVDREGLLSRLLSEPRTVGLAHERGRGGDGSPDGYAILRPGREHSHLGPLVADDASALRALLAAAGERLDGASLLLDALDVGASAPDAGERGGLLADAGLSPRRHLVRMTRDGEPLLSGAQVIAGAGFELG